MTPPLLSDFLPVCVVRRTLPSPSTASLRGFHFRPSLPRRLTYLSHSPRSHRHLLCGRGRLRLHFQHHITQLPRPPSQLLLLPRTHLRRVRLPVLQQVIHDPTQPVSRSRDRLRGPQPRQSKPTKSSPNERSENAPEPSRTNEMNRANARFEQQKQNGLDRCFPEE